MAAFAIADNALLCCVCYAERSFGFLPTRFRQEKVRLSGVDQQRNLSRFMEKSGTAEHHHKKVCCVVCLMFIHILPAIRHPYDRHTAGALYAA